MENRGWKQIKGDEGRREDEGTMRSRKEGQCRRRILSVFVCN